jgi:hypothetical protein
LLTGVPGDLGVEDEKRGLEFGSMDADALTMLFQQFLPLRLRADAALPQSCITQHIPDRHPGRSQTPKELDPDQD